MKILPAQYIMQNDAAHARLPHAEEYAQGAAFSNERYSPIESAVVPLLDMGFRNADAAYDVVSVSRGMFFRLDDHLDRMERSCARFRLTSPYTRTETIRMLTDLLRLSGLKDAYVWWAVTRGVARPGAPARSPADFKNMFYAFVIPYRFIADDAARARGLRLHVSEQYIRIPTEAVDARAKNFHWMDLRQSLFEAFDAGQDISVLCDTNQCLTEAPGCNIFVVKNKRLLTPAKHCLEGITRRTVLELAAECGLSTLVGDVPVDELLTADEAFVTSTAGGIMPISHVNGKLLGAGPAPGLITAQLHDLYWAKRWDGWHGTAVQY
jgi:branched-chain amino acid aminotransferase